VPTPFNFQQLALLSTPEDSAIGWILSTGDASTQLAAAPLFSTSVVTTSTSSQAQLWIVFRGTQTKHEWIQDFDWVQVPVHESAPSMLAHRGYVNIYNALKTQIQTALVQFYGQYNDGAVIICGHSLGAGLALVCAHDFHRLVQCSALRTTMSIPLSLPFVYVLAPPRTGNRAFIDQLTTTFAGNLWAIANDSDIVPTLPFAVQPNMTKGGVPWLYAQLPLQRFDVNWGSWDLNHMLPIYINYLKSI
jgi:predicted lipase